MPKGLIRSVGVGGANEWRDVKLVQIYLNSYEQLGANVEKLAEDGKIGNKTKTAIKQFQKNLVGMNNPDGRVDPNGKTFRYLTLYFDEHEQNKIEEKLKTNSGKAVSITKKKILSNAGLGNITVSYKGVKESRKLVSGYSFDVIKLALKEAGMTAAIITSTLRTPEEQASIMLKNAKLNLANQYSLYGRNGDAVLKEYENNITKSDDDIKKLMVAKIEALAKQNKRVSKHCVQIEDYKKLNIIDIGVNSTRLASKNFNIQKFTKTLENLVKEGYIEKLIDETKKSNSCWHLEIKPNKKSIQGYDKGSILIPIRYINGGTMIC